jgi:hypothetical protein
MTTLVADATLPERLRSVTEPVTVVDEGGHTLGYFQPARSAAAGTAAVRFPHSPYSREEIEQRREEARRHPERCLTTAEVLAHLRTLDGEPA